MIKSIEAALSESIAVKQAVLSDTALLSSVQAVVEKMVLSLRAGNAVYWCGNGGSAADAQHLAAELSGRFYYDRPPLNSEALHCNTSFLTAVANDYGYENVFARLLSALGKRGDVLVGLSTSGNSENIVKAFSQAKQMGIFTVAMTGDSGGKLATMADILLAVPSINTPRIQECHIALGHTICQLIESTLFPR